MRHGRTVLVAAMALAAVWAMPARADQPTGDKKPQQVVSCEAIRETYAKNGSVDETANALFVDKERVRECVAQKAGGGN